MKKTVMAAVIAGVMLLSGCSGVSQDEYNSLVEEKVRLEADNSSLQSDNSKLESEKSKATSENAELQGLIKANEEEIAQLQNEIKATISLDDFETALSILAHPKSEILSSDFTSDPSGATLGQYIYSDLTVCFVMQCPAMAKSTLAGVLKENETLFADTVNDLEMKGGIIVYKNISRENICCFIMTPEGNKWIWFDEDLQKAFETL